MGHGTRLFAFTAPDSRYGLSAGVEMMAAVATMRTWWIACCNGGRGGEAGAARSLEAGGRSALNPSVAVA